jgi:hypothetical protein
MGQESIQLPCVDAEEESLRAPSLLTLMASIQGAIEEIGPVVPKLNWSVPADATWMHDLRCEQAGDVLTLLKSSDQVAADLDTMKLVKERVQAGELVLNLVKFHELRDGMQFRCFVREKTLVAISQRDTSAWQPFLKDMQAQLQLILSDFFLSTVKSVFPLNNCKVHIDTLDVYIDLPPRFKCWLLDFGPWDRSVDSGLFTWEELEQMSQPQIRVIEEQQAIRPSRFAACRGPLEMTEAQSRQEVEAFLAGLKDES